MLRRFSDRLWVEGCAPPRIINFQAHIELKPDQQIPKRQPYSVSKYDEARTNFLLEDEEADGKIELQEIGKRPPPLVVPTFIVERKGSLIGRRLGNYTLFSKVSKVIVGYF